MTAFHITAILVIVFLIILFIQFHEEGIPGDFIDWLGCIMLTIMIEILTIMIFTLIGVIIYNLWMLDWYGFFHDIVIKI